MSDETDLPRGLHVSISQASEETGMTRETVSRRIAGAGLLPSGQRGGSPVYRLRDVIGVLYGGVSESGELDISKIADPFKRKAAVQAEREAIELAEKRGELIQALDQELESARVMKLFAQTMDAIPDILERDCGLGAEQVQRVEDELDKLREALADGLSA